MVDNVSPPGKPEDSLLNNSPPKLTSEEEKTFNADKAPGIKKWFSKAYPDLKGEKLNQAVSQFMKIQFQSLEALQKKLDKKQREAARKLKESSE